MHYSARMMFALMADIFNHPRQIACAETNDAVAGLPFQHFLHASHCLIDVVRGAAFQFSDKFADHQRRLNGNHNMNVGLDAADFVNECAGRLDDALF
jgi:CRP-like cAMP-binding protein